MNFHKVSATALFLTVCGSATYGSDLKEGSPLESDAFYHIAQFMKKEDMKNCLLVSKRVNEKSDNYLQKLPSNLITTAFDMNRDISLSKLLHYQNYNFSLLEKKMGKEKLIEELPQIIKAQIEKKNVVFLLTDSSLKGIFDDNLMSNNTTYTMLDGDDLYKKYKNSIDTNLFRTESDTIYKEMIAQHLLSQLTFYVPTKDQNERLQSFWEQNKLILMDFWKTVLKKNNYIQFSDIEDELKTKSHILITDTQMSQENNKKKLEKILKDNPNHRVILNVGDQFVKNGTLNLYKEQIPSNLAHLIICNTKENVKNVGNDFLKDVITLQSFDTRWLKNVTTIGNMFLQNTFNLTSFDTRWLKNVTTIGNRFLYNAGLRSFDTKGLENVTTIGNSFLSWVLNLTSFDARGLKNAIIIGDCFMAGTKNLKFFDTKGLENVTSIGEGFLQISPVKNFDSVQNFLKRFE